MLSVVFFLFYKINRINSFSPVILQPPDKTISQLVQDMLLCPFVDQVRRVIRLPGNFAAMSFSASAYITSEIPCPR